MACEFSGTVRNAFRKRGHDAMSCDLLPSETEGPHYQGDVRDVLQDGWDLMIAHPPCTYLAVSGMHWTTRGLRDPKLTEDALAFVQLLMDAPIPGIAVENPVSVISSRIRKPDQIVQPYEYGHDVSKKTCLWLKNLPLLKPTQVVDGREAKVHLMPPGPNRWKERSRTYQGVADAMAQQWGTVTLPAPVQQLNLAI